MKTLLMAIAAVALLPIASATEISVSFSEDFAEDLEEDYGVAEGDVLIKEIKRDLVRAFEKKGVSPAKVDVMIIDAMPNRPTMAQLREEPGLDMFRSVSIGGMKLEGTAYDAAGNIIGQQAYKWYETDITMVAPAGRWSDANRASERFARKLSNSITGR